MSTNPVFVTAAMGTADLLIAELAAQGVADLREGHGGANASATLAQAYRACLWSRVGLRVLWRVAEFPVTNANELYEGVRTVDWSEHLGFADTLAVDFSGSVPGVVHTRFGAQRVKDAVVDQFRDQTGERPSVDRLAPTLRINVHAGRATVEEIRADGGEVRAQQLYFTRDMQNHHGGLVLVNGYLYGFNNSILTCLEFATGKVMWRHRSVGKGSLAYADGHLYLLSENNVVGLAEATPAGYREKGRFTIADQGWPSWAHPVVSGARLYVRNQGILTAYNIRAN